MQRSIECYLLINFLLDTTLIAVVARANGCLNLRRVLIGGLLASGYAALTELLSRRLAHPLIQLLMLVPLGLLICGSPEPRRWGAVVFQLVCGSLILGGTGMLAVGSSKNEAPWIAAALGAGLLLVYVLLNVRASRLVSWEVIVCLKVHGRSASFRALIDTGNRLREPISGLPVLIAESALLEGLFTEADASLIPRRRVAFSALSGGGTIPCFHPDSVFIRHGNQLVQAPEVWVALYPGKIPGSTRALAPPSFAVLPGRS